MALSKEEVSWVAHLARLEIDEAACEQTAEHLSRILEYIEKLNELNTDEVEPLSHPGAVTNVFREDVPGGSLANADALKNAPDRAAGCFRVPRVLE